MDKAIIIDINPVKCVAGYSRLTLPIINFEPFVGRISKNCTDQTIHEKYPDFIHPDDFSNLSVKHNLEIIPIFTTDETGVKAVNWDAYFFVVTSMLKTLYPIGAYPKEVTEAINSDPSFDESSFMAKLNATRNMIYNTEFNLKKRSFDDVILFDYKSGNSRSPHFEGDLKLEQYDLASAKHTLFSGEGSDPVEILRGAFTTFATDHPIIFATFPCETSEQSAQRLDYCFEIGLHSAQVLDRNTLISMAYERISSFIIETFDKFTTLTPVVDAYALHKNTTIIPIGADNYINLLENKLNALDKDMFAKKYSFSDDYFNFQKRHYILSMLFSKEYFVLSDEILSSDPRRQREIIDNLKQCEELPNFSPFYRNSFDLKDYHYKLPELIFDPQIFGLNIPKLSQYIYDTISKSEREEVKELLWNNVLIAGANPFSAEKRLQNELSMIEIVNKPKVSSLSTLSLKYLGQFDVAFLGGSIIETAEIFSKLWISREEWQSAQNMETKLNILADKSF